jgi:hypothetical protein
MPGDNARDGYLATRQNFVNGCAIGVDVDVCVVALQIGKTVKTTSNVCIDLACWAVSHTLNSYEFTAE